MDEPSDRISSLPDNVLTHVLSFLSAKEAVQTCILSKRWTNVWAFAPVLKFLFKDFFGGVCDDQNYDDELKFDHFVDGVFENRGQSHLDTIIYDWQFVYNSWEPSLDWLDRAALLMPRTISVCIRGVNRLRVPLSVFSCTSLQNFDLSLYPEEIKLILQPKLIALPNLKSLKLSSSVLDDDFAQNLFLCCPSLESLNLEDCHLYISEISSDVLKELKFDGCHLSEHMQIYCPSLVSLFIESCWNNIRIISLVNMSSLVNAIINLDGTNDVHDHDLPDLSILCDLSNATSLRLCLCSYLDLKEQWKKEILKCKMFKNLKSLEIKSQDIMDFDLVACFLEHSPVLQNLTLDLWWLDESTADAQEEPRQHVCFQLEYLETIKIHCGRNDKFASRLISLLGRYVKTIGNVTITW